MRGDIRKSISENGIGKRKFRSRSYDRYFEDWKQVPVPRKRGAGTKHKWVYVGNYYRQDVSKTNWILIRLLYTALFAGSAAILVINGIKAQPWNTVWYVAFSEALCIAALVWILIAFIVYLPSGNLTIGDYKFAVSNLRKGSVSAIISFSTAAFMLLIFWGLHPGEQPGTVLLGAAEFFLAAGMNYVIYRMESSMKYREIPPC